MALNKTILLKLVEKTSDDPDMQAFLKDVLQFESTPKAGWFEKKYAELLETHCKEGDRS